MNFSTTFKFIEMHLYSLYNSLNLLSPQITKPQAINV